MGYKMKIEIDKVTGVYVLNPVRFRDTRGFFCETWDAKVLLKHGITENFVQDNQSFSTSIGTIRGLHYQSPPHAQDKLVRCGRGRLLDVAVDIRKGSPMYGQWISIELSAANGKQLFIPKGFLHGFITLEPDTEILYKCSDYYAPECDRAIRFDDLEIGIEWGIPPDEAIFSEKDAAAPFLKDVDSPFNYESTN